jgi:hypothetical protein
MDIPLCVSENLCAPEGSNFSVSALSLGVFHLSVLEKFSGASILWFSAHELSSLSILDCSQSAVVCRIRYLRTRTSVPSYSFSVNPP